MVASGLEPGMTAVAPIKLTLHLVIASRDPRRPAVARDGLARPARRASAEARAGSASRQARAPAPSRRWSSSRSRSAGSSRARRRGWTYNTWPLMDGRLVPPARGPVRGDAPGSRTSSTTSPWFSSTTASWPTRSWASPSGMPFALRPAIRRPPAKRARIVAVPDRRPDGARDRDASARGAALGGARAPAPRHGAPGNIRRASEAVRASCPFMVTLSVRMG